MLAFGLGLAGMPEPTVQSLEAHLPHLERLAAAAKEAEPHLTALMPILTKAWPDVVAVTPLLQELVAFAKQKSG